MIKINHRIVFWIFSILIIGMILLSCGCNQLLKFYFPQSFSVSKNEMTTNDPLQNAENYNYRIRAQNYADLVSYLPSNSTPVDLRIPNELAGYKVCEIEEGCFSWCEAIKTVYIPSSVNKIGHMAFYDNSSLTSISIENGNCTIEKDSFGNFTGIIYAPQNSQVYEQLKNYGYSVKTL